MTVILAKDLSKEFPRSPLDELDGLPWLPRLIDKVRALQAGTLGDYTPFPCGGDRGFCDHDGFGCRGRFGSRGGITGRKRCNDEKAGGSSLRPPVSDRQSEAACPAPDHGLGEFPSPRQPLRSGPPAPQGGRARVV